MPNSNYPHGFPNGVTIRNFPIVEKQTGSSEVFWVDSNRGSNGNKGNFDYPFATIAYAMSKCTANRGDRIYVAESHVETITTTDTTTFSVAGVQVIGIGTGDTRPTLTVNIASSITGYQTAADNILISNIRFLSTDGNVKDVVLLANPTYLENCFIGESSGQTCDYYLRIGNTTNDADSSEIVNCEFLSPTTGAGSAIELDAICEAILIKNCKFFGDFGSGCIHNPTNIFTNLRILENTFGNTRTGGYAIKCVASSTGILRNAYMGANAYATTIDPGMLYCYRTFSVQGANKNARLNPVVET